MRAAVTLGLTLALLAGGCGDESEQESGFATELPAGWSEGGEEEREVAKEFADEGLGEQAAEFNFEVEAVFSDGESSDEFLTNVNVLGEEIPSGVTPEQYADLSIGSLSGPAGFTDVTEAGSVEVDGESGRAVEYSATGQGIDLRLKLIVVVLDDVGYNFTLTAPVEDFDEAADDFDLILDGWDWDAA